MRASAPTASSAWPLSFALVAALVRPLSFALLASLALAAAAAAQEAEIRSAGLPEADAARLIEIARDPATLRLTGPAEIPPDSVVRGNVVVIGSLRLAGRVEGDLLVMEGDVELARGATVTGDLTVVSGEIRGEEEGRVGGSLTAISRLIPEFVSARGGGEETTVRAVREGVRSTEPSTGFSFGVPGYNRIEGFPLHIGPDFSGGGANPLQVRVRLVLRTAGDRPFGQERLGHRVDVEQFLGGRRELSLGAGVYSLVEPIESMGISDWENGWSTLLFTSDQRDYFERRGERVFLRMAPRALPVVAGVEFVRETEGLVAPADPWTAFRGGTPWRSQPVVAEGESRSWIFGIEVDTRDGSQDPRGGWWARASWRELAGGALALPFVESPGGGGGLPAVASSGLEYSAPELLLDLRRYTSVGPRSTLNLRVLFAGSPNGDPLPPQRQHSLGGIGSLPGHPRFALDCGARESLVQVERGSDAVLMYPAYGCDRVSLVQAEYRVGLGERSGFGGEEEGRESRRGRRPGPIWSVFFDAGRGWSAGGSAEVDRGASPWLYDAGIGFLFENAGVYWAVPVGEGRIGSGRFHLRLERRF